MKKFLLIGQGIAGTALAWALRQRGARVQIADAGFPDSASSVAAGIVNPITGKRFVKSWRLEEFWPAAKGFYQSLEAELGIPLWHEMPLLRLLAGPGEANDWAARGALPDYADWLGERNDAGQWAPLLRPGFHPGGIRKAARVDFAALLPAFREKARAGGFLIEKNIGYQQVESLSGDFDHVVFCEGWRARDNPFFPNLPWQLAKGEAFTLRFTSLAGAESPREMVKKEAMIVPLGNNLFWAGATYNWTFDDEKPSPGERDILLGRLHDMLAAPFEVVGHRAGVRPTVKDRRPFIGLSARHHRIGIFNGLGTKGALLAPYWAGHFADHLLHGTPLDPEVNVGRFQP